MGERCRVQAEAAGVEVEAVVQQDDEEQVRAAAAEGPLREVRPATSRSTNAVLWEDHHADA